MSRIFKASSILVEPKNAVKIQSVFEEPPIKRTPDAPILDMTPQAKSEFDKNLSEKDWVIKSAKREAFRLLKAASDDAERLRVETKNELEHLRQNIESQASKKGYEEGYQKGLAEAEAIKESAKQWEEKAKSLHEETIKNLEPQMLDLTISIVEKLLGKTAKLNPQTVQNLIAQGLEQATITGDIVIRVSKADYEEVQKSKDVFSSLVGGNVQVDIIRDLSLEPLDCIIETPFGNIDCSLAQQFQALKENLYYISDNTK